MKKTSILLTAVLLGGCAMGINHNVATINGKKYLVETKNRTVLGITQWSEPSTFTSLEGDIDEKIVLQKAAEITKSCKNKARTNEVKSISYDYEKFYNCVNNAVGQ